MSWSIDEHDETGMVDSIDVVSIFIVTGSFWSHLEERRGQPMNLRARARDREPDVKHVLRESYLSSVE